MNWPRTISKKELAIVLDYYNQKTGRIYYYKLYKYIFNKTLLQNLKITSKQILRIKIFDFEKTEILLQHLDISMEEIEKIKKYNLNYRLSTV